MSDYAYKPRLGYDIRVRPPSQGRRKPPPWAAAKARVCEAPECEHKAAVRVSKTPRDPKAKLWLCPDHAKEHNRNWNYFEGLSEKEAEAVRKGAIYGDRPTWGMGKNDRARASTRTRGPADLHDSFGLFNDFARQHPAVQGRQRDGRVLPKLQVQAFETLGLRITAPAPEIRRRYAELVRQYHPDANGGDRSAETQLSAVVRAHQILKKARIC